MQHATPKTIGTTTINPDEVERFSRIAEEWWDEHGKFKPLHRINPLRLQFIRDHACRHFDRNPDTLRTLSGLTLLDIGCGGGLLCEPLARLGAAVTGIDASEKNIKVASLHAEQMELHIDYRCTTPEREVEKHTPIRQYDIVLALEIIEHVEDVPLFMESVCALVKPGGLLFMSTMNRTAKSYALAIIGAEYILRWLPVGTHDWNKFVKPSELNMFLRNQHMQLVEQTGMVFSPLRNRWSLSPDDLDVNYLLVAKKEATS